MPRPANDSRVRRFLMQSIMWLILGATVAVAAMVDRHKQQALQLRLGEPIPLTGGAMIRVPEGWLAEGPEDGSDAVELREPGMDEWGRTIQIKIDRGSPLSLLKLFSGSGSSGAVDRPPTSIPFGKGTGTLVIRRIDDDSRFSRLTGFVTWRFTATREIRSNEFATIVMEDVAQPDRAERNRDVDLVKQMAASFKMAPTTQP